MREKIKNSKAVQSKPMQKLFAIGRMIINMIVIIGSGALAYYLYANFSNKVILIISAGFAAVGVAKLAQVAYIAELKALKR